MNKTIITALLLCTAIITAACEKNYSVAEFKKDKKLFEEWAVRCGWSGTSKNCENVRIADHELAIERQKKAAEENRKRREEWEKKQKEEEATRKEEDEKWKADAEKQRTESEARGRAKLEELQRIQEENIHKIFEPKEQTEKQQEND
ncbi:EexN family lipoprotein [Bartonella sp. B1098]|uniref:EexN family lipoprotein n=1 Tax=Bartonella sp. B1098 TaxID=2911421 RepID=UPI0020C5A53F|nr:EexN family lipoprotein [Bartonella sp. B1098]